MKNFEFNPLEKLTIFIGINISGVLNLNLDVSIISYNLLYQ